MGFGAEMKDFISGFQATASIGGKIADRRDKRARTRLPDDSDLGSGDPFSNRQSVPQVQTDNTRTSSSGKGIRGDEIAWKDATPQQRAFLNTLAGPESGGRYNVIYGGGEFNDFSDHPRKGVRIQTGPNAGRTSSAAGKYQFLGDTWDEMAKKHGLTDFSPENQDKGAWYLAAEKVGGEDKLNAILSSGDPNQIAQLGSSLRDIWTSLPGGIEQGTTTDKFVATYQNYLKNAGGPAAVASARPAGAGAIPEEDEAAPVEGAPAEEEAASDEDYSPDEGIEVDPIEISQLAVPQVSAWDQQVFGGPPSDPIDQQAMPAAFAERGGILPEPSQHFAAGGAPVDPYNPSRAYTQAIPQQQTNTFVPRRVGQPVGGAGVGAPLVPGAPTASQLAFRKLKSRPPVVDPVVTPKKEEAPKPMRYTLTSTEASRGFLGNGMHQFSNFNELDPRLQAYARAYPNKVRLVATGGAPGAPLPQQSLWSTIPGFNKTAAPKYEEGGVIPEFKRGGAVREQRQSHHVGGNVPGVDLVDPGSRGRSSSDDEDDYWVPAKPRTKKATSSSGKGTSGKGAGHAGAKKGDPALAEDRATRDRSGSRSPLAEEMEDRQPVAASRAAPPPANAATDAAIPEGTPLVSGPGGALIGGMVGREQQGPRKRQVAIPSGMAEDDMPFDAGVDYVGAGGGGVTRPEAGLPFGEQDPAHAAAAARQRAVLQQQFPGQISGPNQPGPMVVMPQAPVPNNGPAARAPAQGPDHAAMLRAAQFDLAAGANPKAVGEKLLSLGVTQELWPVELQNSFLGFAEGGAIPERRPMSIRAQDANYTTSAPGYPSGSSAVQPAEDVEEEPERASVKPTKKLLDHVAIALDGGVRFLTDHFGLRGEGAMPAPEDRGAAQAGGQRFAMGEGQATPDEIRAIDDKIDPDRQLDEGKRQMTRIARTMDWYMQQGRPKDAKAAAASLMQYGATRFSRLGSLAGAAYKSYQTSQNPEDLQNTVKYLEKAYEMIPDGASVEVEIDPSGKGLVATRIMADGSEEVIDVTPDELPGMIQSVQSKSAYWQEVFKLADPAGARQQQGWARADKNRAEDRRYRREEADTRAARSDVAADERADRIDARAAARDAAREKSALEKEARTSKRKEVNWDVVNPLQSKVDAARKALTDDPATQTAFDEAASQLWDALPPGANRAQLMKDLGIEKAEWSYTKPEAPPVDGARKAPDGNWYVQKPDGKWAIVEPASGG